MLEPDQVHQRDCLAALPEIPDASIDVVITDPPYPNGMRLFDDTLIDGFAALYESCKKAKHFVVFFWSATDVPISPPGWFEVARHVWHKPDCKSITHYEVIVVWSREDRRKVSRVWSIPILDYRSLRDWKPHPTQKPVKLVRYLLDLYTNEGDTVLDPFVGSGTTAVACKQLRRHCIAIENNPEYAKIAQERLAQTAAFTKYTEAQAAPPEEPEQEMPAEPEATMPSQPVPAQTPTTKPASVRRPRTTQHRSPPAKPDVTAAVVAAGKM
ncbi:MAG TPA: site-specific DNA-methyltransferase [Paludibaculum sp.]